MSSDRSSGKSKPSPSAEIWPSLSSYLPRIPRIEDHLPRLPNLLELVEQEKTPAKSRSRGLFEDLLQARPEVLMQDALEHPEAYDDDVIELLRRMVENREGVIALGDDEAEKLNLATAEFFSASPGKKKEVAKTPGRVRGIPSAPVVEPMDLPSNNAFWWT